MNLINDQLDRELFDGLDRLIPVAPINPNIRDHIVKIKLLGLGTMFRIGARYMNSVLGFK